MLDEQRPEAPDFGQAQNCEGVNIKKKTWYDCQWDNYPQKTHTLTIIAHRTAFNNEQSPYRI